MWTLVGGGEKTLQDSAKPTSKLMPKNANWIQAKVEQFDPKENTVYASNNVKVLVPVYHVIVKLICYCIAG